MKLKSDETKKNDARVNQPVEPIDANIDSHADYLKLRETFAAMPKIPTLISTEDAPVEQSAGRWYNWFLTSEQSGGSIAIHILNMEPGFSAAEHNHVDEEEFFFVLDGELEITVGNETRVGGPGTFAYVPPNTTHAFRALGPCRALHWNSPGGHERLAPAMKRLRQEGRTTAAEIKKTMEDHEYFFHESDFWDKRSADMSK